VGLALAAVQVYDSQRRRYGGSYSYSYSYQEAEEAFFSKQEAFVHGAKAALDAAEAPITRLTLRVESNDDDGRSTIDQFLCRGRDWQDHARAPP